MRSHNKVDCFYNPAQFWRPIGIHYLSIQHTCDFLYPKYDQFFIFLYGKKKTFVQLASQCENSPKKKEKALLLKRRFMIRYSSFLRRICIQSALLQIHKTTPFFLISMCILRDLPQQKNPRALCQGNSPISYVPTFPCRYFFSMKQEKSEEIKRELFMLRGGSHTRAFS